MVYGGVCWSRRVISAIGENRSAMFRRLGVEMMKIILLQVNKWFPGWETMRTNSAKYTDKSLRWRCVEKKALAEWWKAPTAEDINSVNVGKVMEDADNIDCKCWQRDGRRRLLTTLTLQTRISRIEDNKGWEWGRGEDCDNLYIRGEASKTQGQNRSNQ